MSSGEIINRVALSPLVTIDIETYYDFHLPRMTFDLAEYMDEGLILREESFRAALSNIDWHVYENSIVSITCSTQAIVPQWSYLLVSVYLQEYALFVGVGSAKDVDDQYLLSNICLIDVEQFKGKKIILKGCSNGTIPLSAYTIIGYKLSSIVSSLMYGEPCSTVPILKRAKNK